MAVRLLDFTWEIEGTLVVAPVSTRIGIRDSLSLSQSKHARAWSAALTGFLGRKGAAGGGGEGASLDDEDGEVVGGGPPAGSIEREPPTGRSSPTTRFQGEGNEQSGLQDLVSCPNLPWNQQ